MASLAELLRAIGFGDDQPNVDEDLARRGLVRAPTQTLGGKRMEGARPMTEQERTIREEPWTQMGRDAGAFASKAINTAGFGVPGVVLDNMAPETARAIHENEARATGIGNVGGTAAGMALPANALARMLTLAPKTVGATAGTLGLTTGSSGAGDSTTPRDYQAPGIATELANVLRETLGKAAAEDRPMTQDQFKVSRRTIHPKTLEELIADEKAKVKEDPTYTYGPRQRQALEAKAEQNAKQRYEASKNDLTEQEKRLDTAYADYLIGWNKQRAEHLNKGFVERHPTAAMTMTVGGPMLSALLTKGVFGRINSKGDDIVSKGLAAREGDNVRALADNIKAADNYVWRSNVGKGVAAAEAAAIPAELRMMQDVIDKKGLPPDAGARKAAETRMADLGTYIPGMGFDAFSGLVGTGTGALWSKLRSPFPGAELRSVRDHATPAERRLTPDEMAIPLASRALGAREAEQRLKTSTQTPGHNDGGHPAGGGSYSPFPSGFSDVLAATASAPQGSSLPVAWPVQPGGRDPAPFGGASSSPRTLAEALRDKSTADILRAMESEGNKEGHWAFQPRKEGKFAGPPDYPERDKGKASSMQKGAKGENYEGKTTAQRQSGD